jgi:hypothetical protein
MLADGNLLEAAKEAYENYGESKDRFRTELRIHCNKVHGYYELVNALFFDDKLVGSTAVSEKFYSKEEMYEYARSSYHALRRNILMTFNPTESLPEISQDQ